MRKQEVLEIYLVNNYEMVYSVCKWRSMKVVIFLAACECESLSVNLLASLEYDNVAPARKHTATSLRLV